VSASKSTGKKHHCKRHDVSYGALEQCPGCVEDAAPLPSEVKVPLAPPPAGCVNSEGREAWFTKVANDALADVLRLQATLGMGSDDDEGGSGGDWHTENAIKGHRETAIKAMRAAGELGATRETDHLVATRKSEQAGDT